MRDDMKKVLTTPGKCGDRQSKRNNRERNRLHHNPENMPTKENMNKKHRANWGGKTSMFSVKPIKNFLKKNVGRAWDDVYSEICEHADSRSDTGRLLRQYVEYNIELKVVKDAGLVYYSPLFTRGYIELRKNELYVDPDDGLIKKYQQGRVYQYKYDVYSNLSLTEQVVAYAKKYSSGHGSNVRHYELELRDGRLFLATWKNDDEDLKNYTPATAAQAEREFCKYTPSLGCSWDFPRQYSRHHKGRVDSRLRAKISSRAPDARRNIGGGQAPKKSEKMNKFDKMRVAMKYWLHGRGYHNAVRAMEFAANYHTGLRKDKITPEFHHQVSVTSYLRTLPALVKQEEVLAVGFLHDIVEDYDISLKVINSEFGEVVSKAVKLLSKRIGGENITDIEGYFEAMSKNDIASVVKGADRVHNFQTMIDVFTEEKKRTYISECEQHIIPMLKEARRIFPQQEPAYENIKMVLLSQIELVGVTLR